MTVLTEGHLKTMIHKAAVDVDDLVVGSGFGGSVSALRLAEKGHSVAVLEKGKHWRKEDFPETNWAVRNYPKL